MDAKRPDRNASSPWPRPGISVLPARFAGFAAFMAFAAAASAAHAQTGQWTSLPDTAAVTPREETSFTQAGGKFYLIGGRGQPPVQEYTPSTHAWKTLKAGPSIFNHFQAITHAGLIYVICAFDEHRPATGTSGGYPNETPAPNIYIYDPLGDAWIKGPAIPEARRRGSAGAVESGGKFYLVVGNTLGHTGPGSVFLDEFDPATNAWTPLADAPRSRDHFQAAAVNGRIYAMGGRQSVKAQPIYVDLEKVDVYDIAAKTWSTLPSPAGDLPTKRSGAILAPLGNDILFAGGSNPPVFATGAYNLVDAFNTATHTWRPLAPMNRGRQVTGGFVNNGGFYVASGSGGTGGSPTLRSMEVFFLGEAQQPTGDPLVAGTLTPAEAAFNIGIVPAGQTLSRTFSLKHSSGNQGVLISGLKIVGDPAYQLKTSVTAPYLVRPGESSPVEIAFASTGAIPAGSHLEVTLAVPAGKTFSVPLDANRTAAGIRTAKAPASVAATAAPVRYWDGSWLFRASKQLVRDALGKHR